jgi:hypothetical protein
MRMPCFQQGATMSMYLFVYNCLYLELALLIGSGATGKFGLAGTDTP